MIKSLLTKYLLELDEQAEEVEQEYGIDENVNFSDLLEINYTIESCIS